MTSKTGHFDGLLGLIRCKLGVVVGLMSILFEAANEAIAHSKVFYTPLN